MSPITPDQEGRNYADGAHTWRRMVWQTPVFVRTPPDVTHGLLLPHGSLSFPAFLPDATRAVVRTLDADDVAACGVQAVVMNTYHLMQRPGSSTVKALGGLHTLSGWQGPIVTDSGGFQAYSLVRQNRKYGQLTDDGIAIRPEGAQRKFLLTPEKAIQLQVSYDTDIAICLDDCTHVDDSVETQQTSVARTIAWARRGKRTFTQLIEQQGIAEADRPLLFAVIQGGGSRELRRACAEALLEIGFDGFGFGGWPLDAHGNLLVEILGYVRELVPASFPLHALGVGHPQSVVTCAEIGYGMADSALPTRDARTGRLYTFRGDAPWSAPFEGDWFAFVYVNDERHTKARGPVSPWCDCRCCTRYSLGYLHHLFAIGDGLAERLATIHNLRFMSRLCERLRGTTFDAD